MYLSVVFLPYIFYLLYRRTKSVNVSFRAWVQSFEQSSIVGGRSSGRGRQPSLVIFKSHPRSAGRYPRRYRRYMTALSIPTLTAGAFCMLPYMKYFAPISCCYGHAVKVLLMNSNGKVYQGVPGDLLRNGRSCCKYPFATRLGGHAWTEPLTKTNTDLPIRSSLHCYHLRRVNSHGERLNSFCLHQCCCYLGDGRKGSSAARA